MERKPNSNTTNKDKSPKADSPRKIYTNDGKVGRNNPPHDTKPRFPGSRG